MDELTLTDGRSSLTATGLARGSHRLSVAIAAEDGGAAVVRLEPHQARALSVFVASWLEAEN